MPLYASTLILNNAKIEGAYTCEIAHFYTKSRIIDQVYALLNFWYMFLHDLQKVFSNIFFWWYWSLNSGLTCLLDRNSTTWATPLDLFALVILEIGSWFLPRLAFTAILLFYASCCSLDDRHVSPCKVFSPWGDILQTFLPGLAWNCDPPNLNLQCSFRLQLQHHYPSYRLRWDLKWTFCLGWFPAMILLIYASQVVRIISITYWNLC
jgi:hypothetical protein